jgi:hypothetical protein
VFTVRLLGEEQPLGECDDPGGIVWLARRVARGKRRAVEITDPHESKTFLVLPSGSVVDESSLD